MKLILCLYSLLHLCFIVSFVAHGQCIHTPSFGPAAVTESFEDGSSSLSTASSLGPQYTVPVMPYYLYSGIVLSTPDPNVEQGGVLRADFSRGDASWSFCNTMVTASDVPNGNVYLAVNSETAVLTFTLPVISSRVGLYVEGTDVCESSGTISNTIILTAYDVFNQVIGNCRTLVTGIATNWKDHFIGFTSSATDIAKITITGPYIVLDKLTFDPGCTMPLTWYLDTDNDGYYTGSSVKACSSPGTGYKTSGIIGGGDCNDNDATINPANYWYFDSDVDGLGDPNKKLQSCAQLQGYVSNNTDNCPIIANPDQLDTDGDGIGDACEDNGPCANSPSFAPSAVIESFELQSAGWAPSTWGPQFTVPEIPYLLASGMYLTTPYPNNEEVLRADFQQGNPNTGFCNSANLTQSDVPDGYVYLVVTNPAAVLTFALPNLSSKVGLFVEAENCEPTTITLTAYNSSGAVIGSCTTEASGVGSNWKNHFIGFNSSSYDIAKFTISGAYLIDKVSFDCSSSQTWYLDIDGDGYYVGSGVARCNSPGSGYRSTGIIAGSDCDDNDPAIHPGASEVCSDGVDNNCSGTIDEGCSIKPRVTINDVTVYESDGMTVLIVRLDKISASSIKINYATQDGTAIGSKKSSKTYDFSSSSGIVTMGAGTLTAQIKIAIKRDNVVEVSEFFSINLSLDSKSANKATLDKSSAVVTIVDGSRPALTSNQSQSKEVCENIYNDVLVSVRPNPSPDQFTLRLNSSKKEMAILRVYDVLGRIKYTQAHMFPGEKVTIGQDYNPGVYFAEVIQGSEKVIVKLIKTSY